MIRRLAISLFLILSPHLAAADLNQQTKHVVFDLDWTSIYDVTDHPPKDRTRMIEVEGRLYQPTEHLSDAIENLLKHKNLAISFFSGGQTSRNIEVLKIIHLSDGRSLNDIAHQIFSAPEMHDLSKDEAGKKVPFAERYKKDLSLVDKNLDNVVIIDDIANFTMPGQEKNVFWLGKTYKYFDTWKDAQAAHAANLDEGFIPPTQAEYERERHKIVRAYNAIEEALEESTTSSTSFANILARKSLEPDELHIAKGLARLRKSRHPVLAHNSCTGALLSEVF